MKKTILTLALLTAALSANATKPLPLTAAAAATAAGSAVAGGLMVATAGAGAALAIPAAAAATAVAAAAIEQATVNVTGATTVVGAPLLLTLDGAKAVEPSFDVLFKAGQAHPAWKVVQVKTQGDASRMVLASKSGKATLEMDFATSMVRDLKIQKGSTITVETQTSGQGALIKFVKDKTPLGFMVNNGTRLP